MQEDKSIEQRFLELSAADKLKVLLDQASFREFSRNKTITSKFFNNRDDLTNQKTLKCVEILLNRTLQNLQNAEFPDPAVLYALANDEQLFTNKVRKRIGQFAEKLFVFQGINLVQFATMSRNLAFTAKVFEAVNKHEDFSVTHTLPSGKTYCHIAAIINDPELLGFWIDQHVDPSRPDLSDQTPLDDAKTYKSIDAQNALLRYFAPAPNLPVSIHTLDDARDDQLRHFNPDHNLPVSTSTLEENAMQDNKEAKRVNDIAPTPPPAPDFGDDTLGLEAAAIPQVENLLGLPSNVQDIFGHGFDNAAEPAQDIAEPLIDLETQVKHIANNNNKAADFAPPSPPLRAASPKRERAASPVLEVAPLHPPREEAAPAPRVDASKGKEERTAEDIAEERRLEALEQQRMIREPIGLVLKRRQAPPTAQSSTGPNFDETEAVVGGSVVRPAGDEAPKAPAEGINAELTKIVSVPYRGKNDPSKPLNKSALGYFEIFKHDPAAGKKLIGILAKLGIKDLITSPGDKTLGIPGDDPTRVVVLAGNTAKITTFHLKERKGEKLVTRAFGYETAETRIMNRPDIKRNLKDSEDRTPLHFAMLSSSFPMVQVVDHKCELLASEENAEKYTVNMPDTKGYTAVHFAAMVGNFNNLVLTPETKLYDWYQYDAKEDAELFLKKNRELTFPSVTGLEPLEPSVIISFMNSKGANYGKRSVYGETPLQSAILNNSSRLIPALAECSAQVLDINDIEKGIIGKKTTANMSIVHYAAMHPEVTAETLTVIIEQCYPQALAKGVDPVYGCVNLRDADGNTPLHYAAATGNLHAILVLMSHGADTNLVNHAGKTPLQIASRVLTQAKGNDAFLLKFSTDVPGVQNVMGRFGPDAGKQRVVTQEVINEFKEVVTHEILQGRLFNKVTKKLDEIFPLWYELVGPETPAPQSEAAVKPGKIYLLADASYMLRTPENTIVHERLPAQLGITERNYASARKSVLFKKALLEHTTAAGQTKVEPTNTLSKQVDCYRDAALMLLIMGGAQPELDSRAPLHARKLVECELELKRVTDPNFTKTFDKSKKAAYAGLITNGTKSTAKEFNVPDLPNAEAVASSQMLLRNYYSRGFKNQYVDRFFAAIAHPGRGHHESVKAYQAKLDELPNDKEGQLEAGNAALNRIAKDIRNNPFPHRRAQGSSALSRVAVSRELIDRSYTNGQKQDEVPELETDHEENGAAETFDRFDVEQTSPRK